MIDKYHTMRNTGKCREQGERTMFENDTEAFGVSATEVRYEPAADDVYSDAEHHIEMNQVDEKRVAKCPVYRAAVLGIYQAKLEQRDRLINIWREAAAAKQPSTATHAFGWTDHEAGNSSWAGDEF